MTQGGTAHALRPARVTSQEQLIDRGLNRCRPHWHGVPDLGLRARPEPEEQARKRRYAEISRRREPVGPISVISPGFPDHGGGVAAPLLVEARVPALKAALRLLASHPRSMLPDRREGRWRE